MADENKTNANPPSTTTVVNTGGGAAIHGNVTVGDDFVGRDKIVNNYYGAEPKPPADSQEAVLFIPFLRKSATEFVGRDAELVELHEKLQQNHHVGVRPAAALTGLGGIGKTQLAVEYAYRYQASYPGGIFWINAADLNRVRSHLVETAERMGLRADHNTTDNALLADLVKRCQQQPATLLCFDNAPDAVILWRRLTQELNAATLGAAILITTRRRDLPPNMAALDLRRLSDSTVRQLLGTARPGLLTDPDLPRLLERLGGLPLVVSLVANALQNSPDATIADYLAALAQHGEELVHEELDVHVADYDLYRGVYTRTLLPVLREQWERLCQQPKSENAQLLLRIAGQLPEAAEISIARLGLLAGLQDEKVIKPLTSAIQTLWKVALIEELKADAIRLHPLVRNFAEKLTSADECAAFRTACTQHMADAYTSEEDGIRRLSREYTERGITSLLLDLITALDLAQAPRQSMSHSFGAEQHKSPISSLRFLLRALRLEAHHLQGPPQSWLPERLLQQLLQCNLFASNLKLSQQFSLLLQHTLHWLPQWRHQRQSTAVEQILTGHLSWVNAIAVLNSNRIVSASHDCTVKVWNLVSGTVEQTLGHKDDISAVAVLDNNRIVSCASNHWRKDCTLKVWNLTTGTVEQTLVGHKDGVNSIAVLDANRIVSGSSDHTLKIWNLTTGTVEQTLVGHKDRVNAVAVLNANYIVSASGNFDKSDCTLNVWDLLTGTVVQTLVGHQAPINAVAILDHQRIVSASGDSTLKVWNLITGTVEQTLVGHKGWVNSVSVIDTQHIISAGEDRTLKLWDLITGTVIQTFSGHEHSISAVAVLDLYRVVSASVDCTLRIWNPVYDVIEQRVWHESWVRNLVVIDANYVVSAAGDASIKDYTLKIWNLLTGTLVKTLNEHEDIVTSVAVVDTNRIVSSSADHKLKVWNLATDTVEQTLIGHKDEVNAVAVLNNNRIVSASGSYKMRDYTLKVWNLATGMVEQTLVGHEGEVNAVTVVDTQRIISASDDRTLKVWNLATGTVEQTLVGHEGEVNAVTVVNTQRIISASDDRTLKVWNLVTGMVEQTLVGHAAKVHSVAVVDFQHIVSASDDYTLKLWNLQTGQVLASIGLDGAPQCVAVARQGGRTLVVAGDRGGALYCLELVEPVGSGG